MRCKHCNRHVRITGIRNHEDICILLDDPVRDAFFGVKKSERIKIWLIYYLPHENYCGATSKPIHERLHNHKTRHGRNIDDRKIIAAFLDKRSALDYEKHYQLTNNTKGYTFTSDWREKQRNRDRSYLYEKQRKPIVCIEDGEVFNSVRECERHFGEKTSGNLSKHLNGKHKTFMKRTFKYIQDGK